MRTMAASDASSTLPRRAAGVEIVRHGVEPLCVIAELLGAGSPSWDNRISILRTPLSHHA